MLADYNIHVYEIEHMFNENMTGGDSGISCIFSDDNANKVFCRAEITDVSTNPLSLLERIEKDMMSMKIKGVYSIDKTSIRILPGTIKTDTGAIINKENPDYINVAPSTIYSDDYVIDTVGTNLVQILNMPEVDTSKTFSNDLREIYDVFGIEGARSAIIHEINEVLSGASGLNSRHIELLADVMTARGILQSVDRYGVKKGETGPWARASFEETTFHFVRAAVYGEIDNMKGMSSNVMFG